MSFSMATIGASIHSGDIQYSETQRCKLEPVPPAFRKASSTIKLVAHLSIYCLGFESAPFMVGFLPFVIDYCPIQLLIFRNNTSPTSIFYLFHIRNFIKLICGLMYAAICAYNVAFILSFLLFAVSLADGTQSYVASIYPAAFKVSLVPQAKIYFGRFPTRYEHLWFFQCYRNFKIPE